MQIYGFKTNQKIESFGDNQIYKDPEIAKRMERGAKMAFLQQRLFFQTNFKPSSMSWIRKFFSNDFIQNHKENSQIEKMDNFLKNSLISPCFIKIKPCSIKKIGLLKKLFLQFFVFNKVKVQSGFVSFLFLPFVALMMTGIIGLSFLSVGIKNITRSQSYCIKTNINGQKELGVLLTKLLNLNDKVLFFHTTRKTLEASLVTATALGMAGLISSLKKKLEIVKQTQKTLMIRQNRLLTESFFVKRTAFNKLKKQFKQFNIFDVQEETFYKKALAVRRKKEGDKAYIYKPVPDFVNHQKSRFFWKMKPFFPLDENWQILLQTKQKNFSSYSCTASLKKKGEKWTSILYH